MDDINNIKNSMQNTIFVTFCMHAKINHLTNVSNSISNCLTV